jgi:hypothetical protein
MKIKINSKYVEKVVLEISEHVTSVYFDFNKRFEKDDSFTTSHTKINKHYNQFEFDFHDEFNSVILIPENIKENEILEGIYFKEYNGCNFQVIFLDLSHFYNDNIKYRKITLNNKLKVK